MAAFPPYKVHITCHILSLQLYACGVPRSALQVTSSTAGSYRFHAAEHCSDTVARTLEVVRLQDGAVLVPDEYSMAGREEFCKYVFTMICSDKDIKKRVFAACDSIVELLSLLQDITLQASNQPLH